MTENTVKRTDMINGPILQSLLLFALPIFISNIFQQFYNTMDAKIVGNSLGDAALAAIGACTPVYDLLVGIGLGIGNGLAIVTARSYGSGDTELLKRSVTASVVIGAGTSLILTLVAHFTLYPLLQVLNTPPEIIENSYQYISTITAFTFVMFAYNLCAGLLRAIGNSLMPLVFLILSSCLNVGLDLYFITRLNMGVKGAAVATVIAQGISAALCVGYIFWKSRLLVPERRHFAVEGRLYGEMLGQGLSMGFMSSIVSVGSVILQYGINNLGYLTIAGHTAARKLYMFSIMPLIAMSLAYSTFVSQNRGADRGDRIIQATKVVYVYSAVVTVFITIATWFAAPGLVKWLSGSSEAEVLENGAKYLRINAPFYVVLGWLAATRNGLQGLGQKLIPLISSVLELAGKILFVAVFLPVYGYTAVILCEPLIWCVMEAQLLYSFTHNAYMRKWKAAA